MKETSFRSCINPGTSRQLQAVGRAPRPPSALFREAPGVGARDPSTDRAEPGGPPAACSRRRPAILGQVTGALPQRGVECESIQIDRFPGRPCYFLSVFLSGVKVQASADNDIVASGQIENQDL